MRRHFLLPAVCSACALVAGAAGAQSTATANMGVTATVTTVCSITETDLAFGEVSLTADTDGTGGIQATCTNGGAYTIALDNGLHATGAQRAAVSGANTLNYNLFQDAAHSIPWNATPGADEVAGTGDGAAQALVVYGVIPTGQVITSGAYADTVVVTISY